MASIPLKSFDRVVLPRGHGITLPLHNLRYSARYPSRDQALQAVILLGRNGGLLVHTNDRLGALIDWSIIDNHLTIRTQSTEIEVLEKPFRGQWQDGADTYGDWAHSSELYSGSPRTSFDFISTLSSKINRVNLEQLRRAQDLFGKNTAGWLTQYRRWNFDTKYPDYLPGDPAGYSSLIRWCANSHATAMPYINGLLVDIGTETSRALSEYLIRDERGRIVRYSTKLPHLGICCPASGWQMVLRHAFDDQRTVAGADPSGVYLDVLAATRPHQCFSTGHKHPPGDPIAWSSGVKQILELFRDKLVLVEGNAEIYNNYVDGYMMHQYTTDSRLTPVWSRIYSRQSRSYGWDLRNARSDADVIKGIELAIAAGASSLGSPYLTSRIERQHATAIKITKRNMST